MDLPVDRFCNAIYAWVVPRVKDREQFDFQLTQPVPGRVRPSDVERERAEFADFMGSMGAG